MTNPMTHSLRLLPATPGQIVASLIASIARGILIAGVAITLSGCHASPVTHGFAKVANLTDAEASFHWHSPGVLGTPVLGGSGSEPIPRCELYTRSFDAGDQEITISSGSATKSFTLAAPSSGQVVLWVVIRADGTIEETTEAEAPASPFCGR